MMKISRVVLMVLLSSSRVWGRLGLHRHGKENHDETNVQQESLGLINQAPESHLGDTGDDSPPATDEQPRGYRNGSFLDEFGKSAAQEADSILSAGVSRIVGGVEAEPNQFPYYASLRRYGNVFFCGATLIGKKTLLTAAHCTVSEFDWAYVGSIDSSGTDGIEVRFQSVVDHPDYNANVAGFFDYKLIELAEEYSGLPSFPRLELNSDTNWPNEDGEILTTIGQGSTEDGPISDKTLFVDIPFVPKDQCEAAFESFFSFDVTLSSTDICAGDFGRSACQGDSGGPLVKQQENGIHTLVGVTSWGYPGVCGSVGLPAVFQQVSKVEQWIADTACAWEKNQASFCAGHADNTSPITESPRITGEITVLYPDADTFVRGQFRQIVLGDEPSMSVKKVDSSGEPSYAFVKFDLAGISKKVLQAELNIYAQKPSRPDAVIEGFKMTSDWDEGISYESFEANLDGQYSSTASFTIPDPQFVGRKIIDVTSDIQDWIDGEEDNFGWILMAQNDRPSFLFAASEDIEMNRPTLSLLLEGDCSGTFEDKVQLTKDALDEAVEGQGFRAKIMSRFVRLFLYKVERYFERQDYRKAEKTLAKIQRFLHKKLKTSDEREALMETMKCLLDTIRSSA